MHEVEAAVEEDPNLDVTRGPTLPPMRSVAQLWRCLRIGALFFNAFQGWSVPEEVQPPADA